ncbi:PQQ-binding-like beta-propeller repeat protein [Chondromyces crocatus]|uniref:Pyrrolo-quinoline quinone repeat domain-containing protein n=1 Tax=Chondromyces crocatus TaxID=52 RepID=A0A0K1ETQ9_CHOCO|nr:PQQ-binding-like beta-propeller repeat protein [Chondromyces crocatus]AKT44018.1 uncharacterized protein CMC5_082560 [Chondromyces crocatus]
MQHAAYSSGPLIVTAFDGLIVAYDRTTGQTAWRFQTNAEPPHSASPCPAYARIAVELTPVERVFVVTAQLRDRGMLRNKAMYAQITALDYRSGHPLWMQTLDMDQPHGSFSATTLVDGGQVILFHGGGVMACSISTGQILWQRASEHGYGGRFLANVELAVAGKTVKPI